MRVGIGYDIHAFSDNLDRRLVLGGVFFEDERGLEGHSDADVVSHAICDALLGAAGKGDIGDHFPPGDERWRNADSLDLLARVVDLTAQGFLISNVDVSIIAERPRVGARKLEMRGLLATVLRVPLERVSIKATTNEQLGAVGRGEGIAALAVALIEERA
jgi:2-C-methyl-D-erythritol 2,4-cyclodiphosphate synthase